MAMAHEKHAAHVASLGDEVRALQASVLAEKQEHEAALSAVRGEVVSEREAAISARDAAAKEHADQLAAQWKQHEASAASVDAVHRSEVSLLEQRLAALTESETSMAAEHEAAVRDLEARHAEVREADRKRHEASS